MAPKSGPVFGGRDTTMATLKCLACGHDNNVGDEWCSSCSSSLNLRLCSACEAINANDAERCHSCNAEFRIEPEVVTFEMDAPLAVGEPVEAAPAVNSLPAVWRLATEQARKRSSRSTALLAVLPVLAAGAAYYFYAASPATQAPRTAAAQVAPRVEAAQKSEPGRDSEAAALREPARPETADVKPAPVVSGKIAAPRTAAAPARSASLSEPKRTAGAVTHTRATGAEMSGRTAADLPARAAVTTQPVTAQPVPVSTTVPLSATSAPAAGAGILPVSESAAAPAEQKRSSVTHTKADLTESAVITAAPAAATQARTVPAEAGNEEPAGCPPAVAALALCKSR